MVQGRSTQGLRFGLAGIHTEPSVYWIPAGKDRIPRRHHTLSSAGARDCYDDDRSRQPAVRMDHRTNSSEGVYSIYVAHPYSGVYMLKDTFTVSAVVIDLSTSTKTADRSRPSRPTKSRSDHDKEYRHSPVNNLVVVDNILPYRLCAQFHEAQRIIRRRRIGKTPLRAGLRYPHRANSSATVTFAVKVDVAARTVLPSPTLQASAGDRSRGT